MGHALEALEALQARAGQTSAVDINPLTSDLPLLRARYAASKNTITSYQRINNLMLAAEVTDSYSATDADAPACNKFSVDIDDIDISDVRRARNIVVPNTPLCKIISGFGFASFYPDDDGIVRSSTLLINANNKLYTSSPLSIYAAIEKSAVRLESPRNLSLNNADSITTNNGLTVLNQFYNTDENQGFRTISYNESLAKPDMLAEVRGKIVLIGEAAYTGMPGYATPVSADLSPLLMTATSLSNLIQNNYILRPDWLPLTETILLVVLVAGCLIFLPRMGWVAALIVGISIGIILLILQTWLITAQHIWLQLTTTAVYVTAAVFLITSIRGLNQKRRHKRDIGISTLMSEASSDSLDAELSVLRHKKPNAINKRKIYDIAEQYEQTREFAKAEQALKHLADVDPDYMDVGEKLRRISGSTPSRPDPAKEAAAKASGNKALGRYEIMKTLGRGAMSTVYLGIDSKIQRKVAIKTIALANEFDDSELQKAREQFLREAESAGRLNHPDIVAIYDIGEDQNIAYLAMEYFSGAPLIDYADRKKLLPPVRVLELVARAADALDYAHGQNVVHRDVKPANILYDAATDRLKLTDFGIARLTDTSRTKTGVILGTPSYMSPEQLSASGVTGQSDLYSLGVTLYHLLVGAPPFRADSIPQLMDKIIHDKPPKLTKVRADLPACIDNLMEKALAKNPDERFPNGKAMALALRACSKQVQP